MKQILQRIQEDMKTAYVPLGCIFLYILVVHYIFGREVCALYEWVGIPCPACGITRAAICLLRGDFPGAYEMNLFIYPLCILAIAFGICRYLLNCSTKWIWYILIPIIAVGIIYYIYRMYTWFPDRVPMIYNRKAVFYPAVQKFFH